MIRRNSILTTAAVLAVLAAPASADTYQDLRSPDAKDAAREAGVVTGPTQDLRSPDAADAAQHRGLYENERGPYVLERNYGSPDAADAARDLPPVQISAPVVEIREPSGGFDWGDAGIGAAGTLALFSIAAGSALLISSRRRRRGFRVAH
jgi:hypothetical protein